MFVDGDGALVVKVRLHLGDVFRREGCVYRVGRVNHKVIVVGVGLFDFGALGRGRALVERVRDARSECG